MRVSYHQGANVGKAIVLKMQGGNLLYLAWYQGQFGHLLYWKGAWEKQEREKQRWTAILWMHLVLQCCPVNSSIRRAVFWTQFKRVLFSESPQSPCAAPAVLSHFSFYLYTIQRLFNPISDLHYISQKICRQKDSKPQIAAWIHPTHSYDRKLAEWRRLARPSNAQPSDTRSFSLGAVWMTKSMWTRVTLISSMRSEVWIHTSIKLSTAKGILATKFLYISGFKWVIYHI